jgi:hypothetical protein
MQPCVSWPVAQTGRPVMRVNDMSFDTKTFVAALAVAALFLPIGAANDGTANAANKTAAAGSDFVYLGTAANPLGATTLLETTFKAGGPQDAVLSVSLECSLVTDVFSTTIDDHPEGYTAVGRAEAHVVVWVEVDGVPVSLNSGGDDGSITFCDRVHQQEIRDIDDSTGNFTIRQLQETMSANAFNWITLDLGSGTHTIRVLGTIEAANTEGSFAQGGIGKRTLVVEPVDFAHGATFDDSAAAASSAPVSADGSSAGAAEPGQPTGDSLLDRLLGF